MSDHDVTAIVEPLVRRQAFATSEDAVRELVLDFVLRQVDKYRARITALEKRYGMPFEQFGAYLKERSALLVNGRLDPEQKKRVAQAVMAEEEDWRNNRCKKMGTSRMRSLGKFSSTTIMTLAVKLSQSERGPCRPDELLLIQLPG